MYGGFLFVNVLHLDRFHFSHNGETWDLPEDFENKTLPHKTGDERVAVAPG